MKIYQTPIHQLHQKRQNQEISSTQIVESVWQRIEQHQDKLNAYLCLEKKEKLLQKAEQIDEQIQKGAEKIHPLAAMPLGLKDIFITQGLETTAASKILKGFIPPYESTASKKLLDLNYNLTGKLNMDEFAMGASNENSAFGVVGGSGSDKFSFNDFKKILM